MVSRIAVREDGTQTDVVVEHNSLLKALSWSCVVGSGQRLISCAKSLHKERSSAVISARALARTSWSALYDGVEVLCGE